MGNSQRLLTTQSGIGLVYHQIETTRTCKPLMNWSRSTCTRLCPNPLPGKSRFMTNKFGKRTRQPLLDVACS
eukprot:7423418-Karenia_brevis.AAC.1